MQVGHIHVNILKWRIRIRHVRATVFIRDAVRAFLVRKRRQREVSESRLLASFLGKVEAEYSSTDAAFWRDRDAKEYAPKCAKYQHNDSLQSNGA